MMAAEEPFDIVMATLAMRGMNGLAFLRRVGEISPQTFRILITGGFGDDIEI